MGIFNGALSGCMLHIWLVFKKGCRRGHNLEGEDTINSSLKDQVQSVSGRRDLTL